MKFMYFAENLELSWSEFVQGLYTQDSPLISSQCFGDWMLSEDFYLYDFESSFSVNLLKFFKMLVLSDDSFDSSEGQVSKFTNKLEETCQFVAVYDDVSSWCLDNIE